MHIESRKNYLGCPCRWKEEFVCDSCSFLLIFLLDYEGYPLIDFIVKIAMIDMLFKVKTKF